MRPYVYIWLVGLLLLLVRTQTHWFDPAEGDLFSAIKTEDYVKARTILAAGDVDVMARNPYNFTFLHLSNDPVLSRQLIAQGANVNAGSGVLDRFLRYIPTITTGFEIFDQALSDKKTKGSGPKPLHIVSSIAVAKLLIDAGADVNAEDSNGHTAIYRKANKVDWVRLLLERGADVNSVGSYGNNVLMKAVDRTYRGEDWSAVRLLVDAGAELNRQNKMGFTVLHKIRGDNPALANYLILAGADINIADDDGDLPICFALSQNAKYVLIVYVGRSKGQSILSRCSGDRDIFQYAREESSKSTQLLLQKLEVATAQKFKITRKNNKQ